MSTAPVPLRAATVAGAVLAVIFIVLSAAVSCPVRHRRRDQRVAHTRGRDLHIPGRTGPVR